MNEPDKKPLLQFSLATAFTLMLLASAFIGPLIPVVNACIEMTPDQFAGWAHGATSHLGLALAIMLAPMLFSAVCLWLILRTHPDQ